MQHSATKKKKQPGSVGVVGSISVLAGKTGVHKGVVWGSNKTVDSWSRPLFYSFSMQFFVNVVPPQGLPGILVKNKSLNSVQLRFIDLHPFPVSLNTGFQFLEIDGR